MRAVHHDHWTGPPPTEAEIRRWFQRRGLRPSAWASPPGTYFTLHHHPWTKVLRVVWGHITFTLPEAGETISLQAGDTLVLPARTPHAAVVGPAGVRCLEAFWRSQEGPPQHHHTSEGAPLWR